MSINFKDSQSDRQEQSKRSEFNGSVDFERWASEVRPLLLAALQRRSAKS